MKRGASLLFALLIFLVCAAVGSVVLTAGTAASGRMAGEIGAYDQRYFSVMSAARLLKDRLTAEPITIYKKRIKTTTKTKEADGGWKTDVSITYEAGVMHQYETSTGEKNWKEIKLSGISGTGIDDSVEKALSFLTANTVVSRVRKMKYDGYDNDNKKYKYTITLDDVTLNDVTGNQGQFHFADMFTLDSEGRQFIPGEDITVYAISYNDNALTAPVYSNELTTNSLFADGTDDDTALIENIRHLENLDNNISNISHNGATIKITNAVQLNDLDWNGFMKKMGDTEGKVTTICSYNRGSLVSKGGHICPYPLPIL